METSRSASLASLTNASLTSGGEATSHQFSDASSGGHEAAPSPRHSSTPATSSKAKACHGHQESAWSLWSTSLSRGFSLPVTHQFSDVSTSSSDATPPTIMKAELSSKAVKASPSTTKAKEIESPSLLREILLDNVRVTIAILVMISFAMGVGAASTLVLACSGPDIANCASFRAQTAASAKLQVNIISYIRKAFQINFSDPSCRLHSAHHLSEGAEEHRLL